MFSKDELLTRLKNLNPWTKCAVVFLLVAIVLAISSENGVKPTALGDSDAAANLSTYIPVGQRLVPIEILNSGALDSILGRYGFVDLYLEGQRQPFARTVRIVKSIDQSGDWAALVSKELADELMSAGARFRVAIRSQDSVDATSHMQNRNSKKRTIIYEEENLK